MKNLISRFLLPVFVLVPMLLSASLAAIVPAPKKMQLKGGVFRCRSADLTSVASFHKDASMPKEGYRLEVTPESIGVWSSDEAGAFYAVKTLEQLAKKT